jgi:hypothetical protein
MSPESFENRHPLAETSVLFRSGDHPDRARLASFIETETGNDGPNGRPRGPAKQEVLMGLQDAMGNPVSVAGFLSAVDVPLPVESSLSRPLEQELARVSGRAIDRKRIVEVESLTTGAEGGTCTLLATLAMYLEEKAVDWIVVVADRALRARLRKLGALQFQIARVGDDKRRWIAIHVPQFVRIAVGNQTFEAQCREIWTMARCYARAFCVAG